MNDPPDKIANGCKNRVIWSYQTVILSPNIY